MTSSWLHERIASTCNTNESVPQEGTFDRFALRRFGRHIDRVDRPQWAMRTELASGCGADARVLGRTDRTNIHRGFRSASRTTPLSAHPPQEGTVAAASHHTVGRTVQLRVEALAER